MKTDVLLKPGAPILHIHVASDDQVTDWLHAQEQLHKPRVVARAIRGTKCGTEAAFFSEIGAAWQLPHYFGENWDALVDSLSDPHGKTGDAEAYVLVVRHAVRLLDQEPGKKLKTFADVMTQVAERLSTPVGKQAAIAFRVILQTLAPEEAKLRTRLKEAGVAA